MKRMRPSSGNNSCVVRIDISKGDNAVARKLISLISLLLSNFHNSCSSFHLFSKLTNINTAGSNDAKQRRAKNMGVIKCSLSQLMMVKNPYFLAHADDLCPVNIFFIFLLLRNHLPDNTDIISRHDIAEQLAQCPRMTE